MKKQKVTFQKVSEVEGGPNYEEFMANENVHRVGMRATGSTGKPGESIQANPDNLTESAGYWAVDEETQNVQLRVRKMLELAKQILTEQQYTAFVLVDIKKLKLREAGKVMSLTHKRVDQLIKRAHVKLQQIYLERTANV